MSRNDPPATEDHYHVVRHTGAHSQPPVETVAFYYFVIDFLFSYKTFSDFFIMSNPLLAGMDLIPLL
jgi:hypothetical protein